MKMHFSSGHVATLAIALAAITVPAAAAEDGWRDTAEFGLVTVSGNAESTSFAFKNTAVREWERSSFTFNAGGLRVENTTITRFATDEAGGIAEGETKIDDVTAENYYLNGRYDREITERFFWYGGAGWDRNEPAGIKNRYIAEGGVGNIWYDNDDVKFKTSYAVTYTDQEDVFTNPLVDDTFLGLRLGYDYSNKLTETTQYFSTLVIDENLDETSDWRANFINAVAVQVSTNMALKVSLQLLYDNEPAFDQVVVLPGLLPGGGPGGQNAFIQLDDLDTIFTASLVVNF